VAWWEFRTIVYAPPLKESPIPTAPWIQYPLPHQPYICQLHHAKYAEKLVNSIPTYTNTATDKDKFSKFPTKHQGKNPKYVFDKKEFPKLSKTNLSTTDTTSNQSPVQKDNHTETATKQPTKTTNSSDKIPINFKVMQAQIQKNLEKDFTVLLYAKFKDFHSDVKDSFAKLNTRYDTLHTDVTELGNTVNMLMKQQQRMHETLESLQNNIKSPSRFARHLGD